MISKLRILMIVILFIGIFCYLKFAQKPSQQISSADIESNVLNSPKQNEKISKVIYQLPSSWDKMEKTYDDGSITIALDPVKVTFDEGAVPAEKRAGLVEIKYNFFYSNIPNNKSTLKPINIGRNSALSALVSDEKIGADFTTVIVTYVSDLNDKYLKEFNQIISSLDILK